MRLRGRFSPLLFCSHFNLFTQLPIHTNVLATLENTMSSNIEAEPPNVGTASPPPELGEETNQSGVDESVPAPKFGGGVQAPGGRDRWPSRLGFILLPLEVL
jgi:hypothetical protein